MSEPADYRRASREEEAEFQEVDDFRARIRKAAKNLRDFANIGRVHQHEVTREAPDGTGPA